MSTGKGSRKLPSTDKFLCCVLCRFEYPIQRSTPVTHCVSSAKDLLHQLLHFLEPVQWLMLYYLVLDSI